MTASSVPVTELRKLLMAVSEHGAQHLVEVEADLNQTSFLLSGAIEKLGASFMSIHETVVAQQQEIDALIAIADVPQEMHHNLVTLREKISEEVDSAVTGLQFQDMTSQLIARVVKRVDGLRTSLEMLATHGEDMAPEQEHEEIVNLLNKMSANLTVRHDALHGGLAKSVSQKDMDSGEVELF